MKNRNIVLFASNEGGHFSQLMALSPLFEKYESVVVTDNERANNNLPELRNVKLEVVSERFSIRKKVKDSKKKKLTRWDYLPGYISLFKECIRICRKYRPKVIISTGSDIAVPLMLWGKMHGAKTVFIETRARVYGKTITGKILTPIADKIIVQWPEMLKVYKGKAEYYGVLV